MMRLKQGYLEDNFSVQIQQMGNSGTVSISMVYQ